MKRKVKTPEEPFDRTLLEPGREGEALAVIAERLRQALELTHNDPRAPSDFLVRFASNILTRNARGLDYLANGLNDVSKAVFSEVTGIALPQQQGRTWEALREWAGITIAEDELYHAERREAREREQIVRRVRDAEKLLETLRHWVIDEGRDRIVTFNRKNCLVDADGVGYDLSKRGSNLTICRDYIESLIALKHARAAVAAERQATVATPTAEIESPQEIQSETKLVESQGTIWFSDSFSLDE